MIKTVTGDDFDNSKIYYKVTNEMENHHALQYHDGLNIDPVPFYYFLACSAGGIYFADIKNIFKFLDYGCYVREITVPDDALVYKEEYKYKASKLIFGKRMDINSDTIKYLVENGADIHKDDDCALRWFAEKGHFDIVKCLVEKGADIHVLSDSALRWAANNGHLEVVKYLIEKGADTRAVNDEALKYAASKGHFDMVKYLVRKGADIHANNDAAFRWAAEYGQLEVVKYLVRKGADIHARGDYALVLAVDHQDVIDYINSLK